MADHYVQAKRLIELAGKGGRAEQVTAEVAVAQVHATLYVGDRLGNLEDKLDALLAAWRADIDSEPIRAPRVPPSVVDFAAEQRPPMEMPTPCFGCGYHHELDDMWGGRDGQVRCFPCQKQHEAEAP